MTLTACSGNNAVHYSIFLRYFITIFLLLLLTSSSVIGQQGIEWCATSTADVAQGFKNGTCFRYFTNENLSFERAKFRCSATDVPGVTGDLAQIPSQFAQTTLYQNLLRNMGVSPRNLWIGVRGYSSPEWRWSDGRPFSPETFTNWAPGQPPDEPPANTKYCAYLDITDPGLQWRSDNCGTQKQFICEYKQAKDRPNGYQFVAASYKLDWYSAKVECQREGGQLMDMVTIKQFAAWQNLTIQMIQQAGGVAKLPAKGAVWLGLNRQIWLWDQTDKEVLWSNFSTASLMMEPVQECVYLSVDLDWIPTSCSSQMNFLCQYSGPTLKPTVPTTTQAPVTTKEPEITTLGTTLAPIVTDSTPVPTTARIPTTAAPIVQSTTSFVPPQPISGSPSGTEPYIIAIIVICIVCFIVIVVAILLACCGHLWFPRLRRRIATPNETYIVTSPSPSTMKASPIQVDVAVTAHPIYNTQGTTTNGFGNVENAGGGSLMKVMSSGLEGATNSEYFDDDDSLPQSRISATVGGGFCYSLDEPPNDIPEVYASPTYLYSFPSHRALEPAAPNRIDDISISDSSNLSRSPSSTASPPPPLLPPKVPPMKQQAPPPPPKQVANQRPAPPQPTQPRSPTPPPPFRPPRSGGKDGGKSVSSRRSSDDIVNV